MTLLRLNGYRHVWAVYDTEDFTSPPRQIECRSDM